MLGRSDGVLCVFRPFDGHVMDLTTRRRNPGGIRFGSSELYDVLGLCFSGPTVEQSITDYLAVGQKIEGGMDERVVLFVKLPEGQKLSTDLEQKIKSEIRTKRSPRHVPARVCLSFDYWHLVSYRTYDRSSRLQTYLTR